MLNLRHRVFWLAASVLLVAIVVWGSLETGMELPIPGSYDKAEHFGTYAFLALWFTGMARRGRYWLVVFCLLALGLSMEIGQYLMDAGRIADPLDMAANAAGVGLGIALALAGIGGWIPKVESWLR